ncbi:hypothetical protein GCM10026986_14250 [Nitrincola alkalisediminis]
MGLGKEILAFFYYISLNSYIDKPDVGVEAFSNLILFQLDSVGTDSRSNVCYYSVQTSRT